MLGLQLNRVSKKGSCVIVFIQCESPLIVTQYGWRKSLRCKHDLIQFILTTYSPRHTQ